jgi:hypothetical protein
LNLSTTHLAASQGNIKLKLNILATMTIASFVKSPYPPFSKGGVLQSPRLLTLQRHLPLTPNSAFCHAGLDPASRSRPMTMN